MSDLSKVAIGVKTFLRDPQLYQTIWAIQETMPEVQMLIADDGEMVEEKDSIYADLERKGHKTIVMPFDSGFGAKSNAIVDALERPYYLVGSDDFDFRPKSVREGIEKLVEVLDYNPDVHIASGRVNNRAYEFMLIDEGHKVTETPVTIPRRTFDDENYLWFVDCDLTVNYSLIRKEVFEEVRWDDDVKIGGAEHGAKFVQYKRAGFKTVFVPGVNIDEQKIPNSSRYRQFRARANSPERPCFDRIGVRKYILGDGRIDYDKQA